MSPSRHKAHSADTRESRRSTAIVGAIVILLLYQGYSLSVVGAASPWIAQSFALDPAHLARLFAWMSLSAFGSLILARLADRFGRRHIILLCLSLAPVFSLGAALSPTPQLFAIFEVLIAALLGGSVSSAIVLLAEELPTRGRARGQAFAALASAIGGVLTYIVIPFLLRWGFSWRWLMAPSVAGIGLVVPLGRMIPVSPRWARAVSRGEVSSTHFYDIFQPICRTRALALLACAGLDTMAGTAVNSWLYFEAVSILGLSPQIASTLVVAGMVVGMLGFPIGAWTSEYYGRVPTVVYVGGAAWLGALAFYWGPPQNITWPMLWLLVSYCWFKMGSGVMTVGANSAATELFPTALRTTMIGWQTITAAFFSMITQVIIAALIGPLGGLTKVVRYFALLGIPSAIIFGLFIDETRGLSLEEAAREEAWSKAHQPKEVRTSALGEAQRSR